MKRFRQGLLLSAELADCSAISEAPARRAKRGHPFKETLKKLDQDEAQRRYLVIMPPKSKVLWLSVDAALSKIFILLAESSCTSFRIATIACMVPFKASVFF